MFQLLRVSQIFIIYVVVTDSMSFVVIVHLQGRRQGQHEVLHRPDLLLRALVARHAERHRSAKEGTAEKAPTGKCNDIISGELSRDGTKKYF